MRSPRKPIDTTSKSLKAEITEMRRANKTEACHISFMIWLFENAPPFISQEMKGGIMSVVIRAMSLPVERLLDLSRRGCA